MVANVAQCKILSRSCLFLYMHLVHILGLLSLVSQNLKACICNLDRGHNYGRMYIPHKIYKHMAIIIFKNTKDLMLHNITTLLNLQT